jgi:hypothetical protein
MAVAIIKAKHGMLHAATWIGINAM